MKTATKDFLQGGAFAGLANLAAFLLFVVSVIFPFDWLQQLVLISILFVPSITYYIFANRRTVFFALGMLAVHIVVVGICLLLSIPFENAFLKFIESLTYGEAGFLFGIEFVLEFFLRVFALTVPPVVHLIVHAVGSLKSKHNQRSTAK